MGLVGGSIAIFPGLWANLFTDVEAVRAACRAYLQIVGPCYAFFGLALCLYFASLGAGRVLWPVIAVMVRVVVIVIGCIVLSRSESARPEHFFWLIAAGMTIQAIVVGVAIRLGAWTRGAEPEENILTHARRAVTSSDFTSGGRRRLPDAGPVVRCAFPFPA